MKTTMDDQLDLKEKLLHTAQQCLEESRSERPELQKLKELYESKRAGYGLDKLTMDALIYERIYEKPPEKASDALKIRYWRTGHHYPANRQVCASFARALGLDEQESRWLLTAWMDKSADFYEKVPSKEDSLYWERRMQLKERILTYFRHRYPAEKSFSCGAFRHRYYLDALNYTSTAGTAEIWKKNIYSINYDSELKRTLILLGEIPRKTMLRHLILLSLPFLTLEKLQKDLDFFGYLPLTPEHTLTSGEQLDRLVMEAVTSYELVAEKYGPEEACKWFCDCWQELDRYFVSKGKPGFRLFYFKSLG